MDGKDGRDGINGLDGKDGRDGRDGKDGKDGKIITKKGEKFAIMPGPMGMPGPAGLPGAKGDDGAPGVGVVEGGTTGQALIKKSDDDYDTEWGDAGGGLSQAQILARQL